MDDIRKSTLSRRGFLGVVLMTVGGGCLSSKQAKNDLSPRSRPTYDNALDEVDRGKIFRYRNPLYGGEVTVYPSDPNYNEYWPGRLR